MTSIGVPQTSPTAFSRLKKFAPYMLLGPISGPLAARAVHNFREGRPVLGSLYAVALVEITLLLPVIVGALGIRVL